MLLQWKLIMEQGIFKYNTWQKIANHDHITEWRSLPAVKGMWSLSNGLKVSISDLLYDGCIQNSNNQKHTFKYYFYMYFFSSFSM